MRPLIAVISIAALVVAFGAFTAVASNEELDLKQPVDERKVVHKSSEPASPAQARAAGATTTAQRRGGRRHGPKVSYFVARGTTAVPANGASPTTVMKCPRRRKAIAGYYVTNGGIVVDWFTRGNSARKWEYRFIDLAGAPGEAVEGIVCMTKV